MRSSQEGGDNEIRAPTHTALSNRLHKTSSTGHFTDTQEVSGDAGASDMTRQHHPVPWRLTQASLHSIISSPANHAALIFTLRISHHSRGAGGNRCLCSGPARMPFCHFQFYLFFSLWSGCSGLCSAIYPGCLLLHWVLIISYRYSSLGLWFF